MGTTLQKLTKPILMKHGGKVYQTLIKNTRPISFHCYYDTAQHHQIHLEATEEVSYISSLVQIGAQCKPSDSNFSMFGLTLSSGAQIQAHISRGTPGQCIFCCILICLSSAACLICGRLYEDEAQRQSAF